MYVNGQLVGTHEGFSTPFKFEISRHLSFGKKNVLVLAVDNRPREGKSFVGCLNYTGNWGGIGRTVTLETTPPVYVSDVFVKPRISDGTARFAVTVANTLPEQADARVDLAVIDPRTNRVVGRATASMTPRGAESKTIELSVSVPNARLWSPDNPYLYTAVIGVDDGSRRDERKVRFGVREITTKGNKILLNGSPIFLRGYGDDNVEMVTGMPPTDKQTYIERLRTMKSHGFNFVRHHTWVPYEEYLEAADELGMLVQVEAPNIYNWVWEANAEECIKEWERIILANRNHPSIILWCAGNEWHYGPMWYQRAKPLDPTRPVIHADTEPNTARLAFPTDIYLTHCHMPNMMRPSPEEAERIALYPTLSHEHGGYCGALPDTREIPTFTGIVEPITLKRCLEQATEMGLADEYPSLVDSSRKFLNTTRKRTIECARAIGVQGYSYWLGTDFSEGAEGCWPYGVMTWDWRPKGFTPEELLEYNGSSVVINSLDDRHRTFFSGEPIKIDFSLSHYGGKDLRGARAKWWYEAGGARHAEASFAAPLCKNGELTRLGAIRFTPKLAEAQKILLRVEVWDRDTKVSSNRWPLWVFPKELMPKSNARIAYEEGALRLRARYPYLHYLEPGLTDEAKSAELAKSKLLVTHYLGKPELDYLENGGRVLLLSREAIKGQEASDFWVNTMGLGIGSKIEDHPVFSQFPHDGYCDFNFYGLFKEGCWLPMELLPKGARPVLWALLTTGVVKKDLVRKVWMWEVGVGKGKLLVALPDFALSRPETVYLLDQMLRYCVSERFDPATAISRAELESTILMPSARGFVASPAASSK